MKIKNNSNRSFGIVFFIFFLIIALWPLLNNQDLIFVKELDAVLDFCIMYLCGLNIIPNSTFSWWSAYLSDNDYKKVYIIDKWINESNTTQQKINLYPEHWIKVSQAEHKWKRLFL